MAKWPRALVFFAAVLTAVPVGAQPAPPCTQSSPLVYVGDRDFPPYEYLDERGQPAGFNIELIRALSRELGVRIDIRLLPWAEARGARTGAADLFSAGYVPSRDEQLDFLAPTTTVRSSLLMRQGRASYPSSASRLQGLRIAIQEGTPSITGFDALPSDERPTIVATPSHRASILLLAEGRVDAVAGAGATLRWHAADAGLTDLVEIPMSSRPYMLGARNGCGEALAHVAAAVDRLKQQGVIDQIADATLAARSRTGLEWRVVFIIAAIAAGLTIIALGWNGTLRRQVQARTRALSDAFIDQKRLTDLIQSNEGRLAFAMDVIGEGVWEWDLVNDQIHASTRWSGAFGYRPEEAPTTFETWTAYVHPDDRDRVQEAARAHIEGRAPRFEATYRIPRKGGDWLWILDRGRIVLRDESGKPLRMVGALKDITVQLEAERALLDAKVAAETASRAKTAFLATVSHEIRTPLNAVIGTASLLDHTDLTPDQRELLSLVKGGGDSLLAIVDDVLDFAKIEAGRLELDERPFDLTRVIRDSVGLNEHAARQKGLRLSYTMSTSVPTWLFGDDTRLRQILLNLLSNAVKFTERGAVSLEVTARDDGSDWVRLRFDVEDSGVGIPASKLDRLFRPFSQVDSSTTRRFGGTGLGLAISQRLAELLGGTMEVETVAGQGSTFSLNVGFARCESPVEPIPAPVEPREVAQPLRIILAEDNPVNQLVQRRMLKQLGHRCDLAETGLELLAAVERTTYDLVLLDIQMPEMDGLEAARELRRRGHDRLRLVALTADVTTETRNECAAAGIDEYLSKPVKLESLAVVLARAETTREAVWVDPPISKRA